MNVLEWKKTPWGFIAMHEGTRFTIRWYRGCRKGKVYVMRVNGSAAASPALAHRKLASAMAEAEALMGRSR